MAALIDTLWIEKYRPKTFEEVVDQEEVIEGIRNLLKDVNEMPHLLFAGPPGTGKTTLALIIARELYGETWREYTLELNASDERGINVIREKVKVFSQYFTPSKGAPFKLVILDEADMMTSEAQTALRRIMEIFSRTTRFILICNYLNRIITPIQSRCAIFRFKRVPKELVIEHLNKISKKEGFNLSKEVLEKIYDVSEGDLRKAINLLQSASHLSDGSPSIQDIDELVGKLAPETIIKLIENIRLRNFMDAVNLLLDYKASTGVDGQEIIRIILSEMISENMLTPRVAEILAKYEYRLAEGANEDIQLTAMLAELMEALSGD